MKARPSGGRLEVYTYGLEHRRPNIVADYGHELNLTAGKSGLILDLVIEAGNPADSERLLPMLERHTAFWGAAPRQPAPQNHVPRPAKPR